MNCKIKINTNLTDQSVKVKEKKIYKKKWNFAPQKTVSTTHFKHSVSMLHTHAFKSFLSNVQIHTFFSPTLQKTAMTLEPAAHSAAPPQRVCMWTPLPPTCPVPMGS